VVGDPLVGVCLGSAGGAAEHALTFAADRQRLVLDDRLHPLDQLPRVIARRLAEQDLEATLERLVHVVGAERVAMRRAPQSRFVA
jgi:hypothetical protein